MGEWVWVKVSIPKSLVKEKCSLWVQDCNVLTQVGQTLLQFKGFMNILLVANYVFLGLILSTMRKSVSNFEK